MALAKRSAIRLRVSDLVDEGTALARSAVRECWLPIVILVAAHTILFLKSHAAASDWSPGALSWIAPLAFVLYVPLYGALYRSALGGRDLRTLGFGGLQWSGVEWRLIAVGVVIVFLIALAASPFFAATGLAALFPASHAPVSLGLLGTWSRWAFIVTPIWLIFLWLMAPRLARLMLGWPFSIARGTTEPFAGVGPARHSGWPLLIALLIAQLPLLVAQLLVYALTLILGDAVMGGAWPMPQAIGAGVVVGLLNVAVQAPLSAGVLAGAWWLLEGDAELADHAPLPVPSAHTEAPLDEASAAAAGLSAQEAAELDLPHEEVDAAGAGAAVEEGDGAHAAEEDATDEHVSHEGHAAEADAEAAAPEAEDHHSAPDDHKPDAHAHEAEHVEVPHIEEPAPPHFEEPPPAPERRWGVEPLSPWPHSVLPPWPGAGGFEPPPKRAPLAYRAEPAQPSEEVVERG